MMKMVLKEEFLAWARKVDWSVERPETAKLQRKPLQLFTYGPASLVRATAAGIEKNKET